MTAPLSFDDLKTLVDEGAIDTVLACLVDMQGRLMGKRFHARHFVESAWEETHCCNYLLATDLEMTTVSGYKATSWAAGYGDYVMTPEISTLRLMPWLEGTAMVLCDVRDHHNHGEIAHSPRALLKKQLARLQGLGFQAMTATELEFFYFEQSFDQLRADGYRDLKPLSGFNQDYNIQQTTREEFLLRPLRNHLVHAGIPVECTKGEAETGQEELNIRYGDALDCADWHTIAKQAIKDTAWQQGHAVTFLPKWHHAKVGSSSHIHQSLRFSDGRPAFYDPDRPLGMSETMEHYVAGLLAYAPDMMVFLAPYVNSYKRFCAGSFAPTHVAWSPDNRTAAFRLCGAGTQAIRMECRVGGSDLNPYLAIAAQLAAGIKGIEDRLPLPPMAEGDHYAAGQDHGGMPTTLRAAHRALQQSDFLRAAFGADVVDHYARAAEWECESFDAVVTDYEILRGFERA